MVPEDLVLVLLDPDLQGKLFQLVQQVNALCLHCNVASLSAGVIDAHSLQGQMPVQCGNFVVASSLFMVGQVGELNHNVRNHDVDK